jgi:hypothetical protein
MKKDIYNWPYTHQTSVIKGKFILIKYVQIGVDQKMLKTQWKKSFL